MYARTRSVRLLHWRSPRPITIVAVMRNIAVTPFGREPWSQRALMSFGAHFGIESLFSSVRRASGAAWVSVRCRVERLSSARAVLPLSDLSLHCNFHRWAALSKRMRWPVWASVLQINRISFMFMLRAVYELCQARAVTGEWREEWREGVKIQNFSAMWFREGFQKDVR